MVNCGTLKSALVAIVLLAVVHSGLADEKLSSCCKTVTRKEITVPIKDYMVQRAKPPCVMAVIFLTDEGLYCSQINAPWVLRKINEFRKAKAQTTPSSVVSSSTASLLSILTSTASPPSSSSLPPSSSSLPLSSSPLPPFSSSLPLSASTSEMPAE